MTGLAGTGGAWRLVERGERYTRVIYVPDPEPESVLVITAFDLGAKPLRASAAVGIIHDAITLPRQVG